MALRHFSARGLIAVLAVGLLAAACNPDPGPTPTESPSSTASAPPSATPSPTRTETAQEQKQREAFEAAEKAYREAFAEAGVVAVNGGASEPTRKMRATMTGDYLSDQMDQLRYLKEANLRASRLGKVGWVKRHGYSGGELQLETCEDYRAVKILDDAGKAQSPGNGGSRVYRQLITMSNLGGAWKASSFETAEQLKDCTK